MEIEAGQFALLPDGGLVRIEIVHSDGYVTARRIQGKWEGQVVVCALSKLSTESREPESPIASPKGTCD